FFQAEDGIRDFHVTGVQTCALPISTTEAKAKAVQPLVDKMISLGKRGDLHARRQAAAFLTKKEVVKKLFDEVAPKYATRNGGYRSEERRVGKEWEYRGGGWRVKKVE